MAREEVSPAPRYIAINRNQQVLQPLDVDRLIDEDHAARKIWRVVENSTCRASRARRWL